jgi:hypothetical protein
MAGLVGGMITFPTRRVIQDIFFPVMDVRLNPAFVGLSPMGMEY